MGAKVVGRERSAFPCLLGLVAFQWWHSCVLSHTARSFIGQPAPHAPYTRCCSVLPCARAVQLSSGCAIGPPRCWRYCCSHWLPSCAVSCPFPAARACMGLPGAVGSSTSAACMRRLHAPCPPLSPPALSSHPIDACIADAGVMHGSGTDEWGVRGNAAVCFLTLGILSGATSLSLFGFGARVIWWREQERGIKSLSYFLAATCIQAVGAWASGLVWSEYMRCAPQQTMS